MFFMNNMKNKHVAEEFRILSVDIKDTRLIPNRVLCVLANFCFMFGFTDTIYIHLNLNVGI